MTLKEILLARERAQEPQPKATEQPQETDVSWWVFPNLQEKEMEYGGFF